jgi:hypothetical protein
VGVTRRIIFPTIRIVLWAAIAAALVKLAFAGADVSGADDSLQPSAEIVEQYVEVGTGTITNAVTVQSAVVADPATAVKATMAGTVTKLLAKNGDAVAADTPVLEVTLETPVEPTVTTDPETGEQKVTENKPKIKREKVLAGVAGTLTLTALKDQVVAVGDGVGSVSPGTLSVSGTITPDQQYRLLGAPAEAQVTLKGGPAPFTCTGLRIGAAAQQPTDTTQVADPGASTTPASGTVTCAVPAGVTAFPGLGADIAITNGTAENAVVVPVTSVQGSVQKGNVWVALPDGTNEMRPVVLGLTDGVNVQITEGLAAGDQVLQFIPIGDVQGAVDCDDPMSPTYDPMACAR